MTKIFSEFWGVRNLLKNCASISHPHTKRLRLLADLDVFSCQCRSTLHCGSGHAKMREHSKENVPQFPAFSNKRITFGATHTLSNYICMSKRTLFTGYLKQTLVNEKDQNKVKVKDCDGGVRRDNSSLLETWFYEVSPYGSLSAQLPFNTVITPLNPIDYPDMNKFIIELHYKGEASSGTNLPNSHQLSQISEMYSLDVSFDKDKANMNLNCDLIQDVNVPVHCYLRVPLKFDLSVKIKGNENVTVENMESSSINVETERGNVNLKKIKSGSVSALSKSGNIVSKFTQLGNAILYCGSSGSISADKLQGSCVTCTTEMGSLDVKSLYTENATFKTLTGDVHLGHCHGQIYVVGDTSNLLIESLDGDLDVGIQQGSVNVHLCRHSKVDVDLNLGDIDLSFQEGARTDVNLSSPTINVADNLSIQFDNTDTPHHEEGHIGEKGVAQVNARTLSGNICLSMLSWIQTTKLAFMDREEKKL